MRVFPNQHSSTYCQSPIRTFEAFELLHVYCIDIVAAHYTVHH